MKKSSIEFKICVVKDPSISKEDYIIYILPKEFRKIEDLSSEFVLAEDEYEGIIKLANKLGFDELEFLTFVSTDKSEDKLTKKKSIPGTIALGHTRWATHGEPSKINAHPHTDYLRKIVVVHNGIIENYDQLKEDLRNEGCVFKSDTDTEVVANLIGSLYEGDLKSKAQGNIENTIFNT